MKYKSFIYNIFIIYNQNFDRIKNIFDGMAWYK